MLGIPISKPVDLSLCYLILSTLLPLSSSTQLVVHVLSCLILLVRLIRSLLTSHSFGIRSQSQLSIVIASCRRVSRYPWLQSRSLAFHPHRRGYSTTK